MNSSCRSSISGSYRSCCQPARRLFLGLCLGATLDANAAIYYVQTNGNDALPGTSWANATRTLTKAVTSAADLDEIWVARGTYPEHVTLEPGVGVYGGFSGNETERSQRDWAKNLTVVWGTTNKAVITITNAGPATCVDGFTIGGGNAIHGGGIAMVGSAPVIANCTVRNNITDGAGAGISIWGFYLLSSTDVHFPTITNNVVVDNQSINDEGDGGGIAVINSSPLIAWNVIARNTATRNGGGIACWRNSLPIIAYNFIEQNSASYDELTASSGGGGIFASATDLDGRPIDWAVSAPTIINNIIAANGGRHGGGITLVDSRLGAGTVANNTIVANNGAGVYWANTWPTNGNNIVAFNARGFERGLAGTSDAVIRYNDVFSNVVLGITQNYVSTPDRTGLSGNISADPIFANRAIGEFHLQPGSPCIDAGSTALIALGQTDIDRQQRIQGAAVDMGADEATGTTWSAPTPITLVSPRGDDTDGRTWKTARRSVGGGIASAVVTGGEIWVAEGTYTEHVMPPAFVYLYGGFVGNETNRGARDLLLHPTIIDGGGVPQVVYYRNAGYRVSALDGFTVRNGGAYTAGNPFHPDLTNRFGGRGGAIYCRVCAPDISNNLICSNSLGSPFNSFESFGGGIYCYLGHAAISGNRFIENEVLQRGTGLGGGVCCQESMASIEQNTFSRNHATDGAAVYATLSETRICQNSFQSNAFYHTVPSLYMGSGRGALTLWLVSGALIDGNVFQGNVAVTGGGVCLDSCYSARMQNNLVLANTAYDYSGFGAGGMGGGLYAMVNLGASNIVVANNTFVSNNAPASLLGAMGGAIGCTLVTNAMVVANNILAFNSSGIWRNPGPGVQLVLQNNCLTNAGGNYLNLSAGASDFQSDPRFIDSGSGNFRLSAGSPCIDAGAPDDAPQMDCEGIGRPLDGNQDGSPAVDVGAFEFASPFADSDRDGMLDQDETIAGTNPADARSFLKLSVFQDGVNAVALRWASLTGRTYVVEWSPTLGKSATWSALAEPMPGCGAMMECRDDAGFTSPRFYRLGVRK